MERHDQTCCEISQEMRGQGLPFQEDSEAEDDADMSAVRRPTLLLFEPWMDATLLVESYQIQVEQVTTSNLQSPNNHVHQLLLLPPQNALSWEGNEHHVLEWSAGIR